MLAQLLGDSDRPQTGTQRSSEVNANTGLCPAPARMHAQHYQAGSKGPLPVITDDDELLNVEASVVSGPSTPHELDSPASVVRGGPAGARPWSFIEPHHTGGLTPAGKGALVSSLSFGSTVGANNTTGAAAPGGRAKRGSSASGGGGDNSSSAGSSHGGAAGAGDRSGASSSQGVYPPLPPLDPRPTSSEKQLRLQPFSSAMGLPDDAPLMALGAGSGTGAVGAGAGRGSRRGSSGPQGFVASANAAAAAAAATASERLLAAGTRTPLLPSSSLLALAASGATATGAAGVGATGGARAAPRKARTSAGSPAIVPSGPVQLAPFAAVPEAGAAGAGAVAIGAERRGRSFGRSLSVNAGSLGDGGGSGGGAGGAGAETAPGGSALSARASTPPVFPVTSSVGGGSTSTAAGAGVGARLKTMSLNHIKLGQQQAQQQAQAQALAQGARPALRSPPTAGGTAAVAPHPAWITPGGLSPQQRDTAAAAATATATAAATPGGGRLSQPPSPPQRGVTATAVSASASSQARIQASPTLQGRGSGGVPVAYSNSSSGAAGGRHAPTSAPLPRLPERALYSTPSGAGANAAGGSLSTSAAAFLAGGAGGVARSPALILPANLPPAGPAGTEPGAEASEIMFGHGARGAAPQPLGEGEVPPLPEVVVRVPRWLKPSAFQITEKPRSGRLQVRGGG